MTSCAAQYPQPSHLLPFTKHSRKGLQFLFCRWLVLGVAGPRKVVMEAWSSPRIFSTLHSHYEKPELRICYCLSAPQAHSVRMRCGERTPSLCSDAAWQLRLYNARMWCGGCTFPCITEVLPPGIGGVQHSSIRQRCSTAVPVECNILVYAVSLDTINDAAKEAYTSHRILCKTQLASLLGITPHNNTA